MTARMRHGLLAAGVLIAVAAAVFAYLGRIGQEQTTPMLTAPPRAVPNPDRPQASHAASGQPMDTPAPPATEANLNTITVSPERLQTIGVKFELVKLRPLEKTIRTVGRVEIDERRLEHVNIKLEGWIDKLFVNSTGERVQQGQILFTIYSPELVATQEEYLLALKGGKALGKSEFPEVAEGATSLLEMTRRRLRLWDITEDHIQDLERTGTVLKTLPIHSPATGTVIKKVAVAGMRVNPGDELYTIADLSRIWIQADIYEYELPLIKVGQGATVTLSYDPRTRLHGHVAFIYPTLDPKTRTAKVRFELENQGEKLKPEMYANVELQISLGTRLAVSEGAVIDTGTRKLVFVDRGEGRLEPREVLIGAKVENAYVVERGLSSGERVVASAAFLIDSESQLRSAIGIMSMPGMENAKPVTPEPSRLSTREQKPSEAMPGMTH